MNSEPIDTGEMLISEEIQPDAGTFDPLAMSRGEPGMPTGFNWRGRHYSITSLCASWKQHEPCNHSRAGQRYYRKQFFKVRVDSGAVMTLYALRHVKCGQSPRSRWWIYTVAAEDLACKSS